VAGASYLLIWQACQWFWNRYGLAFT